MRHRYTKSIWYVAPKEKQGTFSSVRSDYTGERETAKAVIAAPVGQMAAAQYGLELPHVMTLTLPKKCKIKENDGVFFEEEALTPWGIVETVRPYPLHTEADVKRLVMR